MKKKKLSTKKGVARRSIVRVGDLVQIMFGAQTMKGKVVEDRGRIGYKGRNLYRILVQTDAKERMYIELPADEIRITRRAPVSRGIQVVRPIKARMSTGGVQKKQELNEV